MRESREVVILANPFSGKGENRARVGALVGALGRHGLSAKEVWDLAERAALLAEPGVGERYRCVVSAGGDGSLAGVLNDLSAGGATSRAAIAMLPLGNENLFAKAFGYDRGVDRLADAIQRCETRAIDAGMAGDRRFTLMASVGFDSEVVRRVDAWRRAAGGGRLKRVNRLSYARPILSAIRGYRYPMVTLQADGQAVDGAHAFVFNVGQYGGGLAIGSHADPGDGLLDWVVFKRPGLLRLAGYGAWAYLRRHLNRGDVVHGRAEAVTLTCAGEALPIQLDGDPGSTTPSTIRVEPSAMRVVVG